MMKNKDKMEIIKAFPLLFLLTVALPFVGGVVGAYIGWDSLKNRFEDNINKEIITEKIKSHESTINKIVSKESIVELGDRAIANGDREAYLKLDHIVKQFGTERNAAISEIARIKNHHNTMTSIRLKLEFFNGKNELIPENEIKTENLIEILLLNTQYLFRARSAQILSERNENFVIEALLISMFSDNNIEVLRESTKAFEKMTGFKSPDFFSPYECLGYWYDNSDKVLANVRKVNNISIIPFQKFESKITNAAEDLGIEEMLYWWKTSFELEQMLKKNHKIENKKNRR